MGQSLHGIFFYIFVIYYLYHTWEIHKCEYIYEVFLAPIKGFRDAIDTHNITVLDDKSVLAKDLSYYYSISI
jgi:hypothetical protein